MDRFPELEDAHQFDNLSECEICELFDFCEDEKKEQFVEKLNESNTVLLAQLSQNATKIQKAKQMNRLLLKKLWECIDEEEKPKAVSFFKELANKFNEK